MSKERKKVRRHLPVFQGILPIKRHYIPTEIIAGITLAALGIPEVMGYTKIAGTPVITGLYTLLFPSPGLCDLRCLTSSCRWSRLRDCSDPGRWTC